MVIGQANLLRSLAILAIVALHVTSGQVNSNFYIFILNQAVRFASPLFIILSGMILCYIEMKRPSPSYGYFLKRRFSKVALPYVIWTFLYTLYTAIVIDDIFQSFKWDDAVVFFGAFADHLMTGTGFVHLYFILIMIQLYAVFPFLLKWLRAHAASLVIVSFLITALCLTAIYLHQLGTIRLPSSRIPYVSLSLNWVFYFVLGIAVAEHQDRWMNRLRGKWMKVILFIACLGSFVILLVDGKLTDTYAISVKPSTMLFAVCSFLFLYSIVFSIKESHLSSRIFTPFEATVNWIAKNAFLIYLLHPLCLGILVRGSLLYGFHDLWMDEIGVTYLFAATVALTLFGILCTNLLPFAAWFGGNYTKLTNTKYDRNLARSENT